MDRGEEPLNAAPLWPHLRARLSILALGIAFVAAPPDITLLWGVNFWGLLPAAHRLVAGLALLLLVLLPETPALKRWPASLPPDLVALVAGALLVWAALPARTWLFGDTAALSQGLSSGFAPAPRSALYSGLIRVVHMLPAAAQDPAAIPRMLAWASALAGLVFLALIAFVGFPRPASRVPGLAALAAGGFFGLFQGYVEVYAVVAVAMALYFALLSRSDRAAPAGLVAAQLVMIAAHALGLVVLPVTLWSLARRRRWTRIDVAMTFVVLAAGLFLIRRIDPATAGATPRMPRLEFVIREIGYAFTGRPWTAPWGVLDLGQLMWVLNGLVLAAGPAVVALILAALHSRSRPALARTLKSPVGAAAGLLLAGRLFSATSMGPVLDWDLVVTMSLPVLFVGLAVWGEASVETLRRPLAPALLTLGAVIYLPMAITLHEPGIASRRVEAWILGRPALRPCVASHAYHALGGELARSGRAAEAAAAFHQAGRAWPRDVYARREGQAWEEAGRPREALQAFDRAIELAPGDMVSREMRAMLRLGHNDLSSSAADFDSMLKLDPENPTALFGLGSVARAAGQDAEARRLFEEAAAGFERRLQVAPRDVALRRKRVLALLNLQRFPDALREVETILSGHPGSLADWYHLGLCRLKLNRPAEARQALERALAIDPGCAPARELLRRLDGTWTGTPDRP